MNVNPTERDITKRCTSAESESPGRTHSCRITANHDDRHVCICSRSWNDSEAVKSQ